MQRSLLQLHFKIWCVKNLLERNDFALESGTERNITSGQKMESRPVWTSLFPKYNVQVEFCPEIGQVKGKLWVSHECLSSQPQTSHLWGVSTAVTDVCLSRPFFALVSWSITSSSLLSVSPQEGAVNTTLHRVTYASLLSSLLTTTAASNEIYL